MLSNCLLSSPEDIMEVTLLSFDNCDQLSDAVRNFLKDAPVFLSPDYLKALEVSGIAGLTFHYIVLVENNKIKGFYYFQILNVASRELGTIVHIEPYTKVVNSFALIINKLLFGAKKDHPHYLLNCGNMCLSGDFGIFAGKNPDPNAYAVLPQVLKKITSDLEKSGKVITLLVKDFIKENDPASVALLANNFNRIVLDPIMKVFFETSWTTFQDYQDALSAKYRLRLNNARKKIADCTVRNLSTTEIKEQSARINELYQAVQHKSPVTLAKPDVQYLLSLSLSLQNKFRFRAYYKGEKMIAFMTGILNGSEYEAHHIGIDYEFNKSHSIYLNILYELIEIAIESGAQQLSYGRTAMEMKTTVGALPVDYNGYLKMNNSLLNKIVKPFLPAEAPKDWTARNPFKAGKDASPVI
ncbi:hypothetical protein BH11BAC2_BH11BAC2_25290 [soil metagenome]